MTPDLEGSSEMPQPPEQELRRDFRETRSEVREMRREIKEDFNEVHKKLNAMNERTAAHIGNESIHREPDPRPCRFHEDHIREHEGSKVRTWGLVLLVISNSIALIIWALSMIPKGIPNVTP